MDMEKFTSQVINIVVALIIVVAVAVPIVASLAIDDSVANASALTSLVGIVPLLLVVGVVLACVGMFLYKRNRQRYRPLDESSQTFYPHWGYNNKELTLIFIRISH